MADKKKASAEIVERTLEFDDPGTARALFGPGNASLDALAAKSGVNLQSRGSILTIRAGAEKALEEAAQTLIQSYGLIRDGYSLSPDDLVHAYNITKQDPEIELKKVFEDSKKMRLGRRLVLPKTANQRHYMEAIRNHSMVFGLGPAGTGKTYLAVAAALSCLLNRQVKRIVLTRPAVEAGEKLGFLPGDIQEKVDPYLRPLYDALHDMHDPVKIQEMFEVGTIEIAPLAFMRGRTINDAFIILDEAQNTTPEQMKMFLTRLGFASKAVITGDLSQIDLPMYGKPGAQARSGLSQAQRILNNIEGIAFINFQQEDVMRHPLVSRIIQAYEKDSEARQADKTDD